MGASDWLSLASCIVAGVAVVISILTSKRRFEFTCSHRAEILQWYQQCVEVLTGLRLRGDDGSFNREEALAKLSALIEVGRFYFPNKVMKHDILTNDKDSAYRGHRDVALDYLVFTYTICKMGADREHADHLRKLSRLFTSRVFDLLTPRKHNKRLKMNSFIALSNADTITIDDIIGRSAEALEIYLAAHETPGRTDEDPAVSVK